MPEASSSLICGLCPTAVVLGPHTGPSVTTGLTTVKSISSRVSTNTLSTRLLRTLGPLANFPRLSTVGRVVGKQCQTIDGNNAGCAFVTDHDTSTYGHGVNMNSVVFTPTFWTNSRSKFGSSLTRPFLTISTREPLTPIRGVLPMLSSLGGGGLLQYRRELQAT